MPLALSSPATAAPITREADAAAAANWRANAAALAAAQPAVVAQIEPITTNVKWMFARDGALTAQDAAGAWWSGCSVPAAAAAEMLRNMGGSGTVACFLCPPSAASVRAALGRLKRNQAIVAIVPDAHAARVMLHCENVAHDVGGRRLWLAVGADWEAQLAGILRENEGLPTPTQFIRLNDGSEDLAEALIPAAQRVLSEVTRHRAATIGHLLERTAAAAPPAPASTPPCVVAPTHFRLWDNAGRALARLAAQIGAVHVDPDDPASASPLTLARTAAACSAVIMPNTGRGELPNVVATSTPWVTWMTAPRIPAFAAAGPRDALLVADPAWCEAAIAAGWPASRVHVAAWPDVQLPPPAPDAPLLIALDLRPLDPPKDVVEMSSHRLLWEAIADELTRDPFAMGSAILEYLQSRMRRLNIAPGTLDERRFIDEAIAPAYARGLAELLRRSGLPLRLAGEGWEAVDSLRPLSVGRVAAPETLADLVCASSALVHAWPSTWNHPVGHAGRPVVRAGCGRESFLRDARLAAAGKLTTPRGAPPVTADLLRRVIRGCWG